MLAGLPSLSLGTQSVHGVQPEQSVSASCAHRIVPITDVASQRDAELLHTRLFNARLEVVFNPIGRPDESLISSMCQATGAPDSAAAGFAQSLYKESILSCNPLDPLGEALWTQRGIDRDPKALLAVRDHLAIAHTVPPMFIMRADKGGLPLLFDPYQPNAIVTPANVPNNAVGLFVQPTGFSNVVANTTGRPWSLILRELQMDLVDPESAISRKRLLDTIRAVREMNVEIACLDGVNRKYKWKQGVQIGLKVESIDSDWMGAVTRVRIMAGAQDVVDGGCAALGQSVLAQHEPVLSLSDGSQIYRLLVQVQKKFPDLESDERSRVDLHDVELLVRQKRVIRLSVLSSEEGRIDASFEEPWSRRLPETINWRFRHELWHPEYRDMFDMFALPPGNREYSAPFGNFLIWLYRRYGDDGLDLLRNKNGGVRDAFLTVAVASHGLQKSYATAARVAFGIADPRWANQQRLAQTQPLDF